MRRAYNELKSIVITPVAPMHPCTCTCVRVGGTHNAIYACEGDRSIDDNRWRRTKNRGGGKGGRRYGRVVERQGRRDGGGGVVSKIRRKRFLSLPLSIYPVSIPFRRRGTEMEVGRRNHQVDLG